MLSDFHLSNLPAGRKTARHAIGKTGLALLGGSFSIWAIIMATGYLYGFSYSFTDSLYMSILGTSSIALTIAGLVFANVGLSSIMERGRAITRYATFFYVWINLLGLYFSFLPGYHGLSISGMGLQGFLEWSGVVFGLYVILFAIFISPFLSRVKTGLLILAVSLYAVFLYGSQDISYWVFRGSQAHLPQGVGLSYVIQLLNPSFGFPWFQINMALTGEVYTIMCAPAIAATAIFAYLFIGAAIRQEEGPVTQLAESGTSSGTTR